MFDREEPYNDLPPLPPTKDVVTKQILLELLPARLALAELNTLGQSIPNQSILLRAAVIQEAKLSSEIENVVTTNDALYVPLADNTDAKSPQAKEVLRYEQAVWHGYRTLHQQPAIDTSLIIELAKIIKSPVFDLRAGPGTRLAASVSGDIVYTPPFGKDLISSLLQNLCDYLAIDDGVDPLIKMAVAHYQFEAIHPFPDGNGRVGRVINILTMLQNKLLEVPVLYLSHYILENRAAYYRHLRDVTELEMWEPWILYLLEAIRETATGTRRRLEQIRAAIKETCELAMEKLGRRYSRELIDLVFQLPYIRSTTLERAGIASRNTAARYLSQLEDIGVLRRRQMGRDVLFINDRLMDMLAAE